MRLGIVVIDVQKSFFASAANKNMRTVLDNTKRTFDLAQTHQIPFFITYEGKKSGDHDIPADLKRALPRQQMDFIKTTYAATGLPPFVKAIKESGATHLIVLGSETDVCVLHTVLGLRELGFQVFLQEDAVFSSEHNIGPALRRMVNAGVRLVDREGVKNLLETHTSPDSVVLDGSNSILEPFVNGHANVALVLNFLDASPIASSGDSFRREKLQRIRELLLLSEWLQIPTYVIGMSAKVDPLPDSLREITSPKARRILDKKRWQPFSEFPKGEFGQVVVAGVDQNLGKVTESLGQGPQVFLMEDALFSAPGSSKPGIGKKGLVPLTYKSFYYGMTKSISLKEWPSSWAERDSIFYPVMEAPEQLPPMGASDF